MAPPYGYRQLRSLSRPGMQDKGGLQLTEEAGTRPTSFRGRRHRPNRDALVEIHALLVWVLVAYCEGSNGLDHGRVLGGGQGVVGRGKVALGLAVAGAGRLDVDNSLGRHIGSSSGVWSRVWVGGIVKFCGRAVAKKEPTQTRVDVRSRMGIFGAPKSRTAESLPSAGPLFPLLASTSVHYTRSSLRPLTSFHRAVPGPSHLIRDTCTSRHCNRLIDLKQKDAMGA